MTTKVLLNSDALINAGLTEANAQDIIDEARGTVGQVRSFYGKPSPDMNAQLLAQPLESLDADGVKAVLTNIVANKGIFDEAFGSSTMRPQIAEADIPEWVALRGKEPVDMDIMLKTDDPDVAAKFAQDTLDAIQATRGKLFTDAINKVPETEIKGTLYDKDVAIRDSTEAGEQVRQTIASDSDKVSAQNIIKNSPEGTIFEDATGLQWKLDHGFLVLQGDEGVVYSLEDPYSLQIVARSKVVELPSDVRGSYAIDEGKPTTIKYTDPSGTTMTAVDIHFQGEDDALAPSSYGLKIRQPSVIADIDGVGRFDIARLSETGVGKMNSVLQWNYDEDTGEVVLHTASYRMKDYVDLYAIIKEYKGQDVADAWANSIGLDLDAFRAAQASGEIPDDITPKDDYAWSFKSSDDADISNVSTATPTISILDSSMLAASRSPIIGVTSSGVPVSTLSANPQSQAQSASIWSAPTASLNASGATNTALSPNIATSGVASIVGLSMGSQSATPSASSVAAESLSASTSPSVAGSQSPSVAGSQSPSVAGSQSPSVAGSQSPSVAGSQSPSVAGSQSPSVAGSQSPSVAGSQSPSVAGSQSPRCCQFIEYQSYIKECVIES